MDGIRCLGHSDLRRYLAPDVPNCVRSVRKRHPFPRLAKEPGSYQQEPGGGPTSPSQAGPTGREHGRWVSGFEFYTSRETCCAPPRSASTVPAEAAGAWNACARHRETVRLGGLAEHEGFHGAGNFVEEVADPK